MSLLVSFKVCRPVLTCVRSVASQAIHRARVNALLFGADRRLLTPRADTLEAYLMTRLSDDTFYNPYRSTAFERLIRFCLERHLFDVALVLYARMRNEGFLARSALALCMTALRIAHQAKHLGEAVPALKTLLENKAYDVPAFMNLVHMLANDVRVDDLAHAFVSIRQLKLNDYPDLVGELARINMRAGRLDAAQAWLQAFEDACRAHGVSPDVAPYSHIIDTLHDIQPENVDAIQDVLARMKSAGVSPDVHVFNALLRANFVQQRYEQGFALYHVLMQKRSETLMPTDVTYKMLFRASMLTRRSRWGRRHRQPDNAVPPRALFRDMFTCHLEQMDSRPSAPSTVVSVSACHLALRTFMAREDYVAAFIVVHALHTFGFQPNLQTYQIVIASLLDRMKREANLAREEGVYRLADVLTHFRPDEDLDLHVISERMRHYPDASPIGTDTMTHLLRLGEPTRSTDDDLPGVPSLSAPSRPPSRVRIPTVGMLTGADSSAHERIFFSPTPLARILYKTLLGELFRKAVHRPGEWNWKDAVGAILRETASEMVPEGATCGEVKEGGRGKGVLPYAAARMRRRRRGARGGREMVFDFER